MAIEYKCEDCGLVLDTSDEMGPRARNILGHPTLVLQRHLMETGHERFSAEGEETKVRVVVYERPRKEGKAVSLSCEPIA